MKYSFITDLSIENCKKKLEESIVAGGNARMVGKVLNYKNTFWIRQKPLNYTNSYQKIFYGEFVNYEEKTLIRGSFSVSKSLKMLLKVGYLFLIFCLVGTIYALVYEISNGRGDEISQRVAGIGIILLLGVFTYVMPIIASNKNKSEEQYVIKFVSSKLNAKEFKENN